MFAKLGPWCHDRRWLVVIVWIVVLIGANVIASSVGDDYRQDFTLKGSESTAGFDILESGFQGQGAGQTGTIVFTADQGVDDPEVEAAMSAIFDDVAGMEGVQQVQSPYDSPDLISQDGTTAYANVEFPQDTDFEVMSDVRDEILKDVPEIDGLRVELGGFVFAEFEEPTSEALGLAFAIVILIVAFGSVLAMGLPVAVALVGIGIGGAGVILFSNVIEVPEFAPFIGVMIGLGVGIDYALLVVTRHREQLHMGNDVRRSVMISMDTAGRSVLFAGATVVISLLGMLFMGIGFIQGLAVTAAITVALVVAASLTLLPALLGFAGMNVERTRWRGLIAAALVAVGLVGVGLDLAPLMVAFPLALVVFVLGFFVPPLKREVQHRPPKPKEDTLAWRWSRVIQHRPWPFAIAGTLVLLLLAAPVISLRLAFSDESNYPEDTTTRQAYDLLVDGFGEGFNGPLFLAAEVPEGTDVASLAAVNQALEADPEVVAVLGPQPSEDGSAVRWFVAPAHGPQTEVTEELVQRLRDDVLPPVEESTGVDLKVTGIVAANIDASSLMSERLPIFFGAVLILSFLLLMVVFRSLLVPLKAVIMNLLSIGAAYGIMVALYQWGWFGSVTGVAPAPIEPWMPMMLFAIVFGLSMDYEVFLLSRIREEWLRTGDSRTSVANGLAATAKVITAAAAIMVVVFGSFILENDRTFKLMGTGLATAILLDATIVRLLLVPATMELLGDKNWWLPRWLDRILPNIDVEGHYDDEDDAGPTGGQRGTGPEQQAVPVGD
ncbi:MMPL family transporter [Dermatobacter hominis]|uniref:MMPL family transporter n=1 Tax=Dermatobacter hominis TaxID=2884263 RepID=UPI001D12D0B7|nr:MMPL family transporter [Dermatobacter hominis]UDY34212.1 MMPL family transporter [Dermatobacter hominis]